jgi:hypothetical protein
VHTALRQLGITDVAMEAYVAEGRTPLSRCLEDVAQCDIYLGIFAFRYGFRPVGQPYSITELEYREAARLGKPCFIFLLKEDAPWPTSMCDRGDDRDMIDGLRRRLELNHLCGYFTGPTDLPAVVIPALTRHLNGARDPFAAGPGAVLTDEIRETYLDRLRDQYHGVETDALTTASTPDLIAIGLTAIFVEPTVRRDTPPEMPRSWWRFPPDGVPDPQRLLLLRDSYQARSRKPLFDIVGDPAHRRVVLLGDPGSGKSAATRYLTLALADGLIEARTESLRGHLPILIELRSYLADVDDKHCDGFLSYLEHRYQVDLLGLPRAALEAYLRSGGRALFLFDGLDEIFEAARRARVVSQIAALTREFPGARVLVTSRSSGYLPRVLTEAGFAHFTLDDLSDSQIEMFLQGWYRLTMPGQDDGAAVQRARIRTAIAGTPSIRELAGNPLLLTILAIVARDQELPKERWRLYDHAADVLISRWDLGRQLGAHYRGAERLAGDARKALLQRLAIRMQSHEGLAGNYITRPDLARIFEDYLVERYEYDRGRASTMAEAIIDQFQRRNFILGRYGQRLYGFVHRTFLEFFCAQAIVDRYQAGDEDWGVARLHELFARRWEDPSWREVLRLLAGALSPEPAGELVKVLAAEVNRPWPPAEFEQPPWNLALAAQCVAELADVSVVPQAAATVLRQVILLVEHGISIEDRSTVALAEEEILPAIRALGDRWPGRQQFLYWYRRRGVKLSWTTGSAFATRIAALLATPQDGIEDLFERELAGTNDRRARYAMVAGISEIAERADPRRRVRCREMLAVRAEHDPDGVVRLAALAALGAHFENDPRTTRLLIDRAGDDPFPDLRLMAVRTLAALPVLPPRARELLERSAVEDPAEPVRRAAVHALGRRCGIRPATRELLRIRLREDLDAGVLEEAGHALIAAGDAEEVRALLIDRVGAGDGSLRRCLLRLLAECCDDEEVRALLLRTARDDADAGCRTVALQEAIRLIPGDLRDVLADRVTGDDEGSLRLIALQALVERHRPGRYLLAGVATADADAGVRAAALSAMAKNFPDAATMHLLTRQAREDEAAQTRLRAAELLVEGFSDKAGTRELISEQAGRERDARVRLAAVRNLIRFGSDGRVHERLLDRVATDIEPLIIREAAEALIGWPEHRDHVRRLLIERLAAGYAGIRLVAADLLMARFDPHELLAQMLELTIKDPDPGVLRLVAEQLATGPCDERTLKPLLKQRALESNPAIRAPAVAVLGRHYSGDPEVCALLIAVARDDADLGVRRAAVQELGGAPADRGEVRAMLTTLIKDADWSVRRSAVHALGRHLDADPAIRRLFIEQAEQATDPDLHCLFTQALSWLPGAGPGDFPDPRL